MISPEYVGFIEPVTFKDFDSNNHVVMYKVFNPIDGKYIATVSTLGVAEDLIDQYNAEWGKKETASFVKRGTVCEGKPA